VLGIDIGGLVTLLARQTQKLLVVPAGWFANDTETTQVMLLCISGQLVELIFDLIGLPIDRDGNLSINGSTTHVDRVPVEMVLADIEADHELIGSVYLTGKILYVHR
jgi:hypothetical protein